MSIHEDFVASYLAAWNEQDAAGIADHLCSGGLYCDVPFAKQLAGTELVNYLVAYFNNQDFRYELLGDVLSNAHTIAFQYRVCPSDPDIVGWSGAEFIVLDGDTARQINDYYRLPGTPSRRGELTAAGRRYAKSGLSDDAMADLLQRLEQAMREHRVYLDPELSLPKLAEELGCTVNHLSQVINAGHEMSFFDYLNQFRVADAAAMLRQKDCKFPAILDVALAVGFNSTSTFYTAFKKATGHTPAKYRRLGE